MPQRILVINGHPDPSEKHACAALAGAYCEGAARAGRHVRRLDLDACDFELIGSIEDFVERPPPPDIAAAQADIGWAEHLVIVFPLWLGALPPGSRASWNRSFATASPSPGRAKAPRCQDCWPAARRD